MIREQRDKYNWDFVFLGANQDAIATAAAMSIPLPSAMSYSTSKAGVAATMAAVSHYVGTARKGMAAAFSAEDRNAREIVFHFSSSAFVSPLGVPVLDGVATV